MEPLPTGRLTPEHFLEDVREAASVLGAPFSESKTREMREVFTEGFTTGAALWKTTNRPNDTLSYRFYARRRTNTVKIATQAGLIGENTAPLGNLVTSWSALNDGKPVQSCDFDAESGLAKSWVFLGATLALEDILAAPGVPARLRGLAPALRDHGLDRVRYTAVDYRHRSANLYFRVPGSLSARQLTGITSLTGKPERSRERVQELAAFLPPVDYVTGLTVGLDSGAVERVAFYASQLPDEALPALGPRLTRFFESVPSHDPHPVNVVAWSFGPNGMYVKAERSWFGDVAGLFRLAGVVVGGAKGAARTQP